MWQALSYKILGVAAAVLSLLMFGGGPAVAATTAFPFLMGRVGSAWRELPGPLHFRRESRPSATRWLLQAPERSHLPGIDEPKGITAGPDGALWFTNPQQLDRADHHRRGGHQLHRPRHRRPVGDHRGSRRRLVVHQLAATTRSGGSAPPGWSPTTPAPASTTRRITAGPDGALWFTNVANNSIGRITTAGVVTNYTGPASSRRTDITAGPDGALWFTNTATTRSGGSPPPGWSPTTPAPASTSPRDHGRSRRRVVVHQLRQQLDRADHHRRGGHQLHRPGIDEPDGITAGPTGRCGSPTLGNKLDRADHHGRGGHQLHRHPASTNPTAITAGPDGALWFTNYGNNSIGRITHGRGGHQLHRHRHRRPEGITAGPTAPCGSPTRPTTRSGGSPRPGGHQLHRHRHRRARGDHGRARRRLVVHQLRQQLDRADHHRRGGHQLHRHRHRRTRRGSPRVPTAPCGSPTSTTTRSGGSPPPGWSPTTPAPASTSPTGSRPGPTAPCGSPTTQQLDRADHHRRGGHQLHRHRHRQAEGITAGPDGALWFTNTATTRSGGSPPPGWSPTTPAPASDDPDWITAGPDGALWFTNFGNDSIGRITTAGVVTNYTGTGIDEPQGITAGPDGALWFTNSATTRSGGSPRHRSSTCRRRRVLPTLR